MRTIKNATTGVEMNVSGVTSNEKGQLVTRYIVGTKFFNKYGKFMHEVSRTEQNVILELEQGWEIVKTKRAPKQEQEQEQELEQENNTLEEPQQELKQQQQQQQQPQAPSIDAAINAFAALTPLFAGVEKNVTANIMSKVQPLLDRVPQEVIHTITINGEEKQQLREVVHPNFDLVCQLVADGDPVYLYGPTGSGKNVLGEQVAKALGLPFHYVAHVTDRFELTGFIDANGNYQATEFYKAYTEGGIAFIDELDGSDENALITLNSCTNGYFAFPCGTVQQHPNFRMIAAGNTCGRGADEEYTGRRVLDASSLCRFMPIAHGYCHEIDMAAAGGDESLCEFIQVMRDIKKRTGCAMILSPRQIKRIRKYGERFDLSELLSNELATYLTADDLCIVQESLREKNMRDNKYADAFLKIKKADA